LIQAKLTINQPNDRYEQEGDRVADAVMRMPEPEVQPKPTSPLSQGPSCGDEDMEGELIQTRPIAEGITPLVQRQPEGEEKEPIEELEEQEEPIMTKAISNGTQQVTDSLHAQLNRSKGGGQKLPETDRDFMEKRFGVDFSGVRVHTNSDAIQMSRKLNAQVFTHGRDIYFGAGRYSSSTSSGKRLLAHELTHVVQQTGGLQTKLIIGQLHDVYEQEADRVAEAAVQMSDKATQQADETHHVPLYDQAGTTTSRIMPILQQYFGTVEAVSPLNRPGAVIQRTPLDRRGVRHRPEGVYFHTDRIDVVVQARQGDTVESLCRRADALLASRLVRPHSGATPEEVLEQIYSRGIIETHMPDVEIVAGRNYIKQYMTGQLESAERIRLGLAIAGAHLIEETIGGALEAAGFEPESTSERPSETIREQPPEGVPEIEGTLYGAAEEGETGDVMHAFLERFEENAIRITRQILDEAERVVLEERERYTGMPAAPHVPETEATSGSARTAVASPTSFARRGRFSREHTAAHRGSESRAREERERLAARMRQIRAGEESTRRTMHGLTLPQLESRRAAEEEFPILAALSPEEYTEVSTTSGDQLRILERHISQRRESIRRVRNGLGDEFDIWSNPRIVRETKQHMGIEPGSREANWVLLRVNRVGGDVSAEDVFLTTISTAFAVLAAATGAGVFAAAAVATGLVEVGRDIEEYQVGRAATRTHFDRDEALSQCDPSAMWLALSIIGLFIDATEFVTIVGRLGRLAHPVTEAIQAAEMGGEALDAARRSELLTSFESAARAEYHRLRELDDAATSPGQRRLAQGVTEEQFVTGAAAPVRRRLEELAEAPIARRAPGAAAETTEAARRTSGAAEDVAPSARPHGPGVAAARAPEMDVPGETLRVERLDLAEAGAHRVVVSRVSGTAEIWMCTHCGRLLGRIDDALAAVSPTGPTRSLHARLTRLRERVADIERRLVRGTLTVDDLPAELNQVGAHLRDLSRRHPDVAELLSFGDLPISPEMRRFIRDTARPASQHVRASEYSRGKHVRGTTNPQRQANSVGSDGQFLAVLDDGTRVTDARIEAWERRGLQLAREGRGRVVARRPNDYHCYVDLGFTVGYADGVQTSVMRVEWTSGRAVHSHPRPLSDI
jgi:hypothetical protein